MSVCSSAATGGASPPLTVAAPAATVDVPGQLHRGKASGEKERRIWPYLKAAKQQFFNVVLATLSVVMAVKMLEGKVRRFLVFVFLQIERRSRSSGRVAVVVGVIVTCVVEFQSGI